MPDIIVSKDYKKVIPMRAVKYVFINRNADGMYLILANMKDGSDELLCSTKDFYWAQAIMKSFVECGNNYFVFDAEQD